MKHIFIINPIAGKKDATTEITNKLKEFDSKIDYEIYVTKCQGDATTYIKQWCTANPDTNVRFYACGGDGTINEVVSGIVGFKNAEMSCYPSGSGNDFVKYYGGKDGFLNFQSIINGTPHQVDLMKVRDRYSLNVCNFGFDAMVAKTMIKVKRKPIIGGPKSSYTYGIIKALFTSRRNPIKVKVDGEPLNNGDLMLCTLSNGRYVGGSFICGPMSLNDDGLIDVSLIVPVSIIKFATMLKAYSNGTYLEEPRFKKITTYKRGKVVEMSSDNKFAISIDGEILEDTYFKVEIMDKAIRFISPAQQG